MAVKQRLAGLKALVTGAGGAIGAAIVKTLARNGATVLAVDDSETAVASLFAKDKSVIGFATNLAEDTALRELPHAVQSELGVLDIVVHADGVEQVAAVAQDGLESWLAACDAGVQTRKSVNLALLPMLKRSPAGRIIHIAMPLALFDLDNPAAQAASRHAIGDLTRSLAAEFGELGITVNTVQPGAIMTPALRGFFRSHAELRDLWIRKSAAKRLGESIDVAKVVLFLATDDAAFVSGQEILVDGGAAQFL